MNAEQVFKQYYRRIAREGVMRALLTGAVIAAIPVALTAFGLWLFGQVGLTALYILLGGFFGVLILSTLLLYFLRFRPNSTDIARRLDRDLGLEERVVTMLELRASPSYIAMLQREDARMHLQKANGLKLHFAVGRRTVIGLAVSMLLFLGMGSVAVLNGWFPQLDSPLVNQQKRLPSYTVTYRYLEAGGSLTGERIQVIEEGKSTAAVTAVPREGYYFWGWSDGVMTPTRSDTVTEEKTYFAFFFPVTGSLSGDLEEETTPNDGPPDKENPGEDGEPKPGATNSGASKYEPSNQIIDGETYYRDNFKQFYEQVNAWLASGEEIPDELRAFLENYYKILE